MKTISFYNLKGGVGKTTTAVNLSACLAGLGKRVLLIDLDPQGNASTGLGIGNKQRDKSIYEVVIGHALLKDSIQKTMIPHLDLVPSTIHLSAAEVELISLVNREQQMKKAFASLNDEYDYVIIDCPPSLGILTVNALTAADSLLIPLQAEFYALEGLSHLLHTVELVRKRLNPNLSIEGIVLTMVDRRNRLSEQVEKDVRSCLGEVVFNTVIPRNIRISEAPSFGKPAIIYDVRCAGSMAYVLLAKELLAREKQFSEA